MFAKVFFSEPIKNRSTGNTYYHVYFMCPDGSLAWVNSPKSYESGAEVEIEFISITSQDSNFHKRLSFKIK